MKNYYSEDISFIWWCIRSIISGSVATISIVICVWGFLIYEQYFPSETLSNGEIRGIGAIIMFTPILIGWHSFLYFVIGYFLPKPKKVIDKSQILRALVFLFIGYLVSSILLLGFQLELLITLISAYIFMLIPLLLGVITANSIEKFLDK
ncbi:hypothetical protein F907_02483 [Acinetobacter colistiniresistens]|uniref:Uncharacterized protein n=1 Tax=Acinetobacter colistiniresistens TaxID=280145 RepID=S3T5J5_9GAMM|nr:hypothetical protein [Acinetobacter colistiniresistens]EPG36786.1 hypothetical protein F907_02483 [Acinetobacter colistiniresistens]